MSSLLQIMSRGTTGAEPVGPTLVADENDPAKTKPYLLTKKEEQLGMRHLSLSLAKNLVARKDVSDGGAPGKIPRAKSDGKIDVTFIPEGTFATRKYVDEKVLEFYSPQVLPQGSSDIQQPSSTFNLSQYLKREDLDQYALKTDVASKAEDDVTVSPGNGLTGGGDLSANFSLGLSQSGSAGSFGSSTQIPVVTTDAFGRISSITSVSVAASGTGGGGSFTRLQIGTATTLAENVPYYVAITASFDGAIQLPSAANRGLTITITDEAGIGSGDTSSSSYDTIYIVCSGSDTISAPRMNIPRSRLALWRRYGTITLVADGSNWRATQRDNWNIDPRTVTGLKCWYDARKGITLSSSFVTNWRDLSGNSLHLSQSVAADRPIYISRTNFNTPGDEASLTFGYTDSLVSSLSATFNSGHIVAIAVTQMLYGTYASDTNVNVVVQSDLTTTAGFRMSLNTGQAIQGGTVSAINGMFMQGAGTGANAPYVSMLRRPSTTTSARAVTTMGVGTTYLSGRANLGGGGNRATASASTAVPSFTQPIRVGSDVSGQSSLYIQSVLVFDSAPSGDDLRDIEIALMEALLIS